MRIHNNFWDLVGFEYKKIFKRKSFTICIILSVIILSVSAFVSVNSHSFYHEDGKKISKFKAMEMDRAVQRSEKGFITTDRIKKAIEQNQLMVGNDDNYIINQYGRFLKAPGYIKYVMPYEKSVYLINIIYEQNKEDNIAITNGFLLTNTAKKLPIDNLTVTDASQFYTKFNEFQLNYLNEFKGLSQNEISKHITMIDKIETPLYTEYSKGYNAFIDSSKMIAVWILFMIAILFSGIFSDEYQKKTDQLLLSSKNGKTSLILAKIFVVITASALLAMTMMGLLLISLLSLWGFDGASAALQTINPTSPYPFTLLQAAEIQIWVVVVISILFASVVMTISAFLKSSFSVIIIAFILLITPIFITITPADSKIIYTILTLMPANAVTFHNIFNIYLYEVLGKVFLPYEFYTILGIIGTVLLGFGVKKRFRKYRVG